MSVNVEKETVQKSRSLLAEGSVGHIGILDVIYGHRFKAAYDLWDFTTQCNYELGRMYGALLLRKVPVEVLRSHPQMAALNMIAHHYFEPEDWLAAEEEWQLSTRHLQSLTE